MKQTRNYWSKVKTWSQACAISFSNLAFWSPTSYRRSQEFVHYIHRYNFIQQISNPDLRQVKIQDLIKRFDTQAIQVQEYNSSFGGVTPLEIIVLCFVVKEQHPSVILEIGTFQGITTLNLALNSPRETRIYTVDLPQDYKTTKYDIDSPEMTRIPVRHDLWQKYGVEDRITQVLCNSALLKPEQLPADIDLAFIDGSHTYEYVKNDTELLQKRLAPGGVLLWHDYSPDRPGVFQYLNELASKQQVANIVETTLGFYVND